MRSDLARLYRRERRWRNFTRRLVPVLLLTLGGTSLLALLETAQTPAAAAVVTTPQPGPKDTPVVLVRWWKQSPSHPDGAIGMEITGDYVEQIEGDPPVSIYVFGPGGGSITILYEDERDNETVLMGDGDRAYEDSAAYYADV